jgi:hypothetical protein
MLQARMATITGVIFILSSRRIATHRLPNDLIRRSSEIFIGVEQPVFVAFATIFFTVA